MPDSDPISKNPQPIEIWDHWSPARERFLQYAEETAELTLPFLEPKGNRISVRPFTQLGAQAVRSLAATVNRITFPPQAKWLKLDLNTRMKSELEQMAIENPEQAIQLAAFLDSRLAEVEDILISDFQILQGRARTSAAMLRNLVENNTGIHIDRESLRIFPLRNLVVFREGGAVRAAVFREEFADDFMTVNADRPESDRSWLYTLVNYEDDVVWQQQEDRIDGRKPPTRVDSDPVQWFVFVSHVPDIDHYAPSYTWELMGLINELNHVSHSMAQAAAAAAWNVPVIREGSALDPQILMNRKPGQPVIANPEDLSWFTSGTKIGDWEFVTRHRVALREELGSTFALGIKDRVNQSATATEILQVAQELDTHTQDLLTSYEDTLQRPLVGALMHIHGFDSIEAPELDKPVTVMITTGTNALQRETSFLRTVQTAAAVKQLDPTLQVDGVELMERGAAALQFETSGLFSRAQPQPEQAGEPGVNAPESGRAAAPPPGGPQPRQPEGTPTGPPVTPNGSLT
jgi:hypothetical protein